MRRKADEFVFTMEEIRAAIILAGTLDPKIFTNPETRSVIYKAKSLTDRVMDGGRIRITVR